jgi:wyosine [tRNA(Phe)-imidazoG37] synthetase (radical SAM superfamily)
MQNEAEQPQDNMPTLVSKPMRAAHAAPDMPFSYPRDFLDNRFVYLAMSPRAHGLSVGVNMNPDKNCNFDCVYCEVRRDEPPRAETLDINVMAEELQKTLLLVASGQIRQFARYARLSNDLMELRHVALSGDGEPTLCPDFAKAVQAVVHVRARKTQPYFKLVLLTNGAGLDSPGVADGLQYFTLNDEVWVKLDAGSQEYLDKINRSKVPLDKIISNTLALGRIRPIVIQSLFALIDGQEPATTEIDQYIQRLNDLKTGGATISLVQIYSATRPMANSGCSHLPLRSLCEIRRRIRQETGLSAEVF